MTYGLGIRCSILLSYGTAMFLLAWPAWSGEGHPCLPEPVAVRGEVVASGVAWPPGARQPVVVDAAVSPTMRKPDRWGRRHGFIAGEDGEPLQIAWLRAGRAFAMPGAAPAPCRDALLRAEAEARGARRGLWRRTRIERADDPTLAKRADRFAVVEGAVVSVGDRRSRVYLNFGTFWREDFTVQILKRDLKRHPELLARIVRSEGRRVRVRGRLTARDGPLMKVRDAGQILFLP